MKENPDYLLEQGANRYLGLVGQDYDALAVSEANKGDYIDIRLNKEFVEENMTEADKDYCDFYGVDVPLEAVSYTHLDVYKRQGEVYQVKLPGAAV